MIDMKRRSRFLASVVALVALAFAQVVLPAHGCPRVAQMDAMTHAMAADDADAMPCERHCVESVKSFDAVKPVVATPPVVVPAPVRVIAIVAAPRPAARAVAVDATGPAPPFLRTTVLRI